MRLKCWQALVASFLLSQVAVAEPESGTYALDPSHAAIVFKVNHFGFAGYFGRFKNITAELDFDGDNPSQSELYVTIDTASVDTTNEVLDGLLKSGDMFDTERFPQATFVSTGVELTGDNTGRIIGDLTMRGITKPATLDVTFNGSGPNPLSKVFTLGFSATTTIKRSEWGLADWLPDVADEVTLMIEAEFAQAQD